MTTIQKTVHIKADRHLRLDLSLPDDLPTGKANVVVIISPAENVTPLNAIRQLAGSLADSKTFEGDPVALQRKLRDEWR